MNADKEDIFQTSFGTIFRETRKARGLSIAQVSEETKINSMYLDALESENLDIFPADIFARSFFKLYANFLEVDLQSIEASFPSEINRPHNLEPLPNLEKTKIENFFEDFLAIERSVFFILIIFVLLVIIYLLFIRN
jgi:cytoskeletal protein RodZ